ncbi:transcription initiation factor TFIID subunit 4 [Drosophila takahashii]|uniref:transcription initiation factor TFIID subunit 4 n=1 Tax=Drosophila takahashii TaxID=29030 RepID=UPI001CF7FA65|nr:uncharacterized protein LOC108062024 [Drosophila takahashii]
MSLIPIEVPMQPYAGKLLVIKNLILPEVTPQDLTKSSNLAKKKPRASFFERSSLMKKLLKNLTQANMADDIYMVDHEALLDAFLAALETYMKLVVQKTIALCEHRSGYHLYNDVRCVMKNDMRTTMMFLNDLEMADYGSSDDDAGFYRKHRTESADKEKKGVRLESVNDTAMLAIGGRKRPAEAAPPEATPSGSAAVGPPAQRPFGLRFKHLSIRDVLQFMEEDRRYSRSNMLFEAYLKYKY